MQDLGITDVVTAWLQYFCNTVMMKMNELQKCQPNVFFFIISLQETQWCYDQIFIFMHPSYFSRRCVPPDIKPPLNTLPSLHLFPLRGELLHIYEGHISVRAVLVEHVTMKYRYAARYTEFVKQRKERILSALLVARSSLREERRAERQAVTATRLAACSPGLSRILPPHSFAFTCLLIISLQCLLANFSWRHISDEVAAVDSDVRFN